MKILTNAFSQTLKVSKIKKRSQNSIFWNQSKADLVYTQHHLVCTNNTWCTRNITECRRNTTLCTRNTTCHSNRHICQTYSYSPDVEVCNTENQLHQENPLHSFVGHSDGRRLASKSLFSVDAQRPLSEHLAKLPIQKSEEFEVGSRPLSAHETPLSAHETPLIVGERKRQKEREEKWEK